MAQPLRVPMRMAAKAALEQSAQAALMQIGTTLRRAMITAKAKVQFSPRGYGRIVVVVAGPGATEAELLLPPYIERFEINVL